MEEQHAEFRLDAVDRVLLRLLQRDALATTEALGAHAQLSPTAAKRRVNKLRRSGTILKDVSVVDPRRLGLDVFTLVFVTLERDRREIVQRFKSEIEENPRIIHGFYTTGDADFVLLVASKSLEDYESFTQEFFWDDSNIRSFKTMVVMQTVKFGTELPIDP